MQQRERLLDIYKDKNLRLKGELERALNLLYSRMKSVKEIVDTKMKELSIPTSDDKVASLEMLPGSNPILPPIPEAINIKKDSLFNRYTPTPQDLMKESPR